MANFGHPSFLIKKRWVPGYTQPFLFLSIGSTNWCIIVERGLIKETVGSEGTDKIGKKGHMSELPNSKFEGKVIRKNEKFV